MILTVWSVRISESRRIGQDTRMTSSASTAQAPTERRARILEAACRVIVRDGAHGLRMASVATEADVSKALVHYYFATRQELLRNTFAFSEQRWQEALDAELEHVETGAARVERMLLATIETGPPFSEQRALGNEVWSSLRTDEELRPVVEGSYRAWLARIVGSIEEGRADGSIPAGVDATAAGWRLAAAGDGLDSLLYLGLVDRDQAARLMRGAVALELGAD
jgi:AcrR family transcriptional regulator